MVQIFGVENVTLAFNPSGDDQRVVPRKVKSSSELKRLHIEGVGRVDCQERPKDGRKILLRFGSVQGLGKTAERYVEELLDDLITDDSLPHRHGLANQFPSPPGLEWGTCVKGIYKDIGIEEEPIAHSFRHG